MKFKVGDRVRVRDDLVVRRTYGGDSFVPDMAREKGNILTIKSVGVQSYRVQETRWSWTDEMFLPSSQETKKVSEKKGTTMSNIKDTFKSKKQKLLEKYVYNGDGIDWSSEVLQKVILTTLGDKLVDACKEQEKEDKKNES